MIKYLTTIVFFIGITTGYAEIPLWSGAEIPYCYATPDSFTEDDKICINIAMIQWERASIVQFKETSCGKFVLAIHKDKKDNYATVGSQEKSFMYIHSMSFYSIAHELGHVIGLVHEHQRPDRDKYITINYENIEFGVEDQFSTLPLEYWAYDYTKYPYDYNSIMHYGHMIFREMGRK
jgi:hypothetical protein